MNGQIDIFDFIKRPTEPENKTLLQRLFGKTNDPVMQCTNCLCEYCVNNVEELWSKVKPDEQRKPCFVCDECRYFTGSQKHNTQRKEECSEFVISDYSASQRRKKIKIREVKLW